MLTFSRKTRSEIVRTRISPAGGCFDVARRMLAEKEKSAPPMPPRPFWPAPPQKEKNETNSRV